MDINMHDPTITPAPLWRRLAAMIYDTLLIAALLIFVGFINLGLQIFIYGELRLHQMTEEGYTLDNFFFYVAIVLAIFTFFAVFWKKKGQTLGMVAWRIQIINDHQQPLTLLQILLRLIIAIPSIALGLTGMLWMKIDPQQKSWQDKISGTRTVLISRQR